MLEGKDQRWGLGKEALRFKASKTTDGKRGCLKRLAYLPKKKKKPAGDRRPEFWG